jgi:hypothetical protein
VCNPQHLYIKLLVLTQYVKPAVVVAAAVVAAVAIAAIAVIALADSDFYKYVHGRDAILS